MRPAEMPSQIAEAAAVAVPLRIRRNRPAETAAAVTLSLFGSSNGRD